MAAQKNALRGQDLLRMLREEPIAPVYLVHGREGWFAERAIGLLKQELFGGEGGASSRSLNFDSLAGKEVKADKLANMVRTVPMFAPQRLVVVRDGGKIQAPEWKKFVDYFDDPTPSTCLFIDWGAGKPDGRTRWVKKIRKNGVMVEAKQLYDRDVPGFVRFAARQREVEMAPNAVAWLAQVVGADLHAIEDAIERLSLFVGERQHITVEDVDFCVADTRSHEVWELTDAVGERDWEGSLRILTRVRRQGTDAGRLLYNLQRVVRQLWQTREIMSAGGSKEELSRTLGVHPFVAGKLVQRARAFPSATLARALVEIADTEVATRSGGLKGPLRGWMALETLVGSLCSQGERAGRLRR